MLCFYDILNDIFDVELSSADLDDLVGGDAEDTQVKKSDVKVKSRR